MGCGVDRPPPAATPSRRQLLWQPQRRARHQDPNQAAGAPASSDVLQQISGPARDKWLALLTEIKSEGSPMCASWLRRPEGTL